MKKIVSLVLVSIMLLCAVPSMAENVELTAWIPVYQFGDGIPDQDFWDAKFDAFEAENNCTVKVEILPWGDYNTTIYTGLLNNEGPDIVYVTDTYDIVNANLLLPLDAYMTEEDKANYLYWDQAPQDAQGNHYTLPMGNAPVVLFYNKDILDKAGVQVPATWDEFVAACKTINEKVPEVRAFTQNWGATTGTGALMTSFWPYFFQAGGEILDAEGNLTVNSAAGLEALEFINNLLAEGIFDETTVAETDASTYFVNGEMAFIAAGAGEASKYTELNWGYVMSLQGSAGYGTRTACDSFAVASRTKHPELAAKAAKLCTSAAVMDAFHDQLYALPPVTADASFYGDPVFEAMYTDPLLTSRMIIVSEFEGKTSFEETLKANVQLMLTGEMTPQEVLDETTMYYEEQIKQ